MSKTTSKKVLQKLRSFWSTWSYLGLLLAALFFAVSLSPSLVPRPLLLQGVASGVALTMGYALGLGLMGVWRFLELPEWHKNWLRILQWVSGVITFGVVVYFYSHATLWQNSVRDLMGMDPIAGVALIRITFIAILLWLAVVYLCLGLRLLYIKVAKKVHQFVPRRISYVVGGVLATIVLVTVVNGVLVKNTIDLIDGTYAKLDQAIPDQVSPPTRSTRSGSSASLVAWNDLGREGQYFVTGGPTAQDIAAVTGGSTQEPVRVYVGLSAAPTVETQAELALAELKRTNAFGREKLVIATPTGTGWIDEGAVDSFEYLYRGDTAIVGVQYSYLSSPITLLLDPDRARDSAQVVFTTIYEYWRNLPVATRPELYIYGLSLGSLGSEDSANIYSLLSDPITGALWVGPPFANSFWPQVMKRRNAGSPAYLPALNQGELVRVLGAEADSATATSYTDWGPLKIVYLLHPSDAIAFFSFDLWYQEPDWLAMQRGADVSPYLTWYPFVTMWQIGLDMLVTTDVPYGHGHNYSPQEYLRAWVELDGAGSWTASELATINEALGGGSVRR